jgi:excisionase family DNA binding protein
MSEKTGLLERPDTVIPSKEDVQLATESSRILSRVDGDGELRVYLEGGIELRLPSAAKTLLIHLLTEMSRGNAVTVIPTTAELTTREAAEFLNVSRPHLIKQLEHGAMPFHKTGTHRRIRFTDLQAYRNRLDNERNEALNELAAQAQELGMGY